MSAERPLYLFAKPPPAVLTVISALPRMARVRPADLLHITLLPFVDLAKASPRFLADLIALLDMFDGTAFHVVFDRIIPRYTVALRGSETMEGAEGFQAALTAFLTAHDFPFFGKPPEPHLTINYDLDGEADEWIDPISWTVDTVLLVESVVGQTRHIEHARWSLRTKP